MGARLTKPARGMVGDPCKLWNLIDPPSRTYGLQPTHAARCCYVRYEAGAFKYRDTLAVVQHRVCDASQKTGTIRPHMCDVTQKTGSIVRNPNTPTTHNKVAYWECVETSQTFESM